MVYQKRPEARGLSFVFCFLFDCLRWREEESRGNKGVGEGQTGTDASRSEETIEGAGSNRGRGGGGGTGKRTKVQRRLESLHWKRDEGESGEMAEPTSAPAIKPCSLLLAWGHSGMIRSALRWPLNLSSPSKIASAHHTPFGFSSFAFTVGRES